MSNTSVNSFAKKVNDLKAHIAKDGLLFYLNTKGYDFYIRLRLRMYGLSALKSLSDSGITNSKFNDAHLNWPSSWYELKQGLKALPIPFSKINLLDFGCGNGNVLLYGMFKKFSKVTGVDLDEKALMRAEKNCSTLSGKGFSTSFSLVHADAATFQIPDNINVIYLFNPFGEVTTQAVAENIFQYVKKFKKPVYVIYFLPSYKTVFDQSDLCTTIFERNSLDNKNAEMTVYRVG